MENHNLAQITIGYLLARKQKNNCKGYDSRTRTGIRAETIILQTSFITRTGTRTIISKDMLQK